jgi:4-diphosphocytidyl-2-C-methyl-D-erythritol kinase
MATAVSDVDEKNTGNEVRVRAFAPAKLNLFLHVVGRRADGYHQLQSVFTLIDFGDTLEFLLRTDGQVRRTNNVPGVADEDDLVVRAARLLQRETGITLGCDIAIEKRIPMGGGLGGGSSDAATTLLTLNRMWRTGLSRPVLQALGLRLGADVPFFIFGESAFAEGIGEALTPVSIPSWWYVVLKPNAMVPTPSIFASPELTRDTIPLKIADFSASGLTECRDRYRNDLQPVVLKAFPEVYRALGALSGAAQKSLFGARMTGSGACVFAAFSLEADAREAFKQLSPDYTGFIARGLEKHPSSELSGVA